MRKITVLICIFLAFAAIQGCKQLDVVPQEVITKNEIWGNIQNAEKALARLYNGMPNDLWAEYEYGTDEAKHHWENPYAWVYNNGSWGPTNNNWGNWYGRYQDIRRANLFLENISSVPLIGDQASYYAPRIPRFIAEARVLRALYYFELFKRFGAVPLITVSVADFGDEAFTKMPRASTDEIVNFIVRECDIAAESLPNTYGEAELGHITKGAALAIKARTLIYAASPLFNGNAMYANIRNPDGKQLFAVSYDKEKWKRAADAAKQVIDLGVYSISSPTPANPVNNYAQLFYNRNWTEFILPYTLGNNRDWEQTHFPKGNVFRGYGKGSVLQELVDDYEMKNGYPINYPGSGYTEDGTWVGEIWDGQKYSPVSNVSNMYKDRDPRFYATIHFQYGVWRYASAGRPIKLAYFYNHSGEADGWPNSGTSCESGYNIRKWSSPDVDIRNQSGTATRNYPIIRYAEMYLIYAEAMNEYLGAPDASVYDAINKVRSRVNMPSLPVIPTDNTREGMRKRIQNENRIEFAFEAHRLWDVRRWMIAKTVDNGPVHGMNALPTQQELESSGFNLNTQAEKAGVAVFYRRKVLQTRVFADKHYLMPIPQSELDKNANLVQNYGW